MRPSAPAALPLFRSETQARLLACLFDPGATDISVTELAKRIGAPLATAAREVSRLESHGIITSHLVGHTKLPAANWKLPFARPLAELLAHTAGLPWIVGEALATVEGVEEAYVFGSWAARYASEPGPPPNDVDLLVVAEKVGFAEAMAVLRPIEHRLGVEINPVLVTPDRWKQAAKDPFLVTVMARPMVSVTIERPA